MGIGIFVAYALIGLVVGVIVRIAMPTTRLVGLPGSALLGLAGGIIGGLIGAVIGPRAALAQVNALGVILAVVFAIVVSVGLILATRNRGFA